MKSKQEERKRTALLTRMFRNKMLRRLLLHLHVNTVVRGIKIGRYANLLPPVAISNANISKQKITLQVATNPDFRKLLRLDIGAHLCALLHRIAAPPPVERDYGSVTTSFVERRRAHFRCFDFKSHMFQRILRLPEPHPTLCRVSGAPEGLDTLIGQGTESSGLSSLLRPHLWADQNQTSIFKGYGKKQSRVRLPRALLFVSKMG